MEHAESIHKLGIIKDSTKIIIIEQLAQDDEYKAFLSIKDAHALNKVKGMRTIVFPAKITEIEQEMVKAIYG